MERLPNFCKSRCGAGQMKTVPNDREDWPRRELSAERYPRSAAP